MVENKFSYVECTMPVEIDPRNCDDTGCAKDYAMIIEIKLKLN